MKKYLKYIIGGICLIVLSLGIGLVIVLKPKKDTESDNSVYYTCTKEQNTTEYNVASTVLNIETVNGRVMVEKSYTELKFSDKNAYDSAKNVNYASQYNYDDSKMIINIDIQTKDMTKTSNGDDLELKYEDYKAELTKNGFSCN